MVVLGVVKLPRRRNLGGYPAVTRFLQRRLVGLHALVSRLVLTVIVGVYRGTVLRSDVRALAHALGRIVGLPEKLQQPFVRHHRGMEHHQHDFGMPGAPAADLLVARIRRGSPRITDGGGIDAVQFPVAALGSPEATHAEQCLLRILRKGRADPASGDEVKVLCLQWTPSLRAAHPVKHWQHPWRRLRNAGRSFPLRATRLSLQPRRGLR